MARDTSKGAVSKRAASSEAASAAPVLVLQGGGALGAYQAGAYETLAKSGAAPARVTGISIGAVNAALIAGNSPERRVAQLEKFWRKVSIPSLIGWPEQVSLATRGLWNNATAVLVATAGVPAFFTPRPAWAWWPEPPVSLYDTSPLEKTLLELVDFDLLNDGPLGFSVGAVDVETGQLRYFDNSKERIGPKHIMASGALPPGFPPVEIDGRWYWDGGLVSNTPLQHVMEHGLQPDGESLLVFQIDLFNTSGALPQTLPDTRNRAQDIRYASRTNTVIESVRAQQQMSQRIRHLSEMLSPEQRAEAESRDLLKGASDPAVTLVHIVYDEKSYESANKDYEFSRLSMSDHWRAGREGMQSALEVLEREPAAQPGEFQLVKCKGRMQAPAGA